MTSPFLEKMTGLLTERGLQVSRFEFEYMAARRIGGKRRPPPRAEKLVAEYESAVAELREQGAGRRTLLIGGKSMGGRVASLAADELFAGDLIDGLVCLGYPFHPPNKPENLRTAHLEKLHCPALIVQGERDPFGGRAEVESYALSPNIRGHLGRRRGSRPWPARRQRLYPRRQPRSRRRRHSRVRGQRRQALTDALSRRLSSSFSGRRPCRRACP